MKTVKAYDETIYTINTTNTLLEESDIESLLTSDQYDLNLMESVSLTLFINSDDFETMDDWFDVIIDALETAGVIVEVEGDE